MSDLSSYLETLRGEVDSALDRATAFEVGCPVRLRDAIRYGVLAPGKRLRPLMALLACELCGGERKKALPAACAIEMIHAYSLIHDDLPAMDDDDLRRGMPTCHKKFDEPTAILAGDALLALAFEMIGNLTPPELAGRCCKELAVAAGPCRLVGGQMDDVSHEKKLGDEAPEASWELVEQIHVRKTSALMRVSLRLGALVAGASEEQLDALDDFGINYGLAFQITDDLLDVLGDEKTVGKRLRKDADKEKWSYPTLIGVDESRKEAERVVLLAEQALQRVAGHSMPLEILSSMTRSLLNREK